jgi:sucrose-6-phosphate hydrolase SacC (GH32 family)
MFYYLCDLSICRAMSFLLIFSCFQASMLTCAIRASEGQGKDIVLADFEGGTYGTWETTGTAFGDKPATGTLPKQMQVTQFEGKGLANSFHNGDNALGTLTSPSFRINHHYINFLIGGGGFADKTCINLLIEGKVVRTATGPNTVPGGKEQLDHSGWDVSEFAGKAATIQIVDNATGGWGHINVDHIVLSDKKWAILVTNAKREITAEQNWLCLPVKQNAPKRTMTLTVDGNIVRDFNIELAEHGQPDWWAECDISAWKGKTITLSIDQMREEAESLNMIKQSATPLDNEHLYQEALRPQFHFSPRRGWNNDPNGLVLHNGHWHLFFQHNPYGWSWGNMHWGHAVSKDLFHWHEGPEVLYPDHTGTMFSGSAVIDWKNTSGFGKEESKPPIVLIYTAAGGTGVVSKGQKFTQCLAYSSDCGKSWTKYKNNPVLREITGGNRDPKVFWHEPTKQWVMVLYVSHDKKHAIDFLTSPDLKDWTVTSTTEGLYECPDFFELPVVGEKKMTMKWVLTGASSQYFIGEFDGKKFTPETALLPGHQGRGFYAAQTYSDTPARRVQIGWMQAPSPGMSFNQCMSLPLELGLTRTKDGPRLTMLPVNEAAELRENTTIVDQLKSEINLPDAGELLELEVTFSGHEKGQLELNVRGAPIVYDFEKRELIVNNQHIALPPDIEKHQELNIFIDRTTIEVFTHQGQVYVPQPFIAKADNRSVTAKIHGEQVKLNAFIVYRLKSTWK